MDWHDQRSTRIVAMIENSMATGDPHHYIACPFHSADNFDCFQNRQTPAHSAASTVTSKTWGPGPGGISIPLD